MVNKEQLFATFDEWDSASYRPHSESSVHYSPQTRWCLGKWAPAAFWVGTLGGYLCRRRRCRRRRHCRHRLRLARVCADGARLMVVQQEQMFVELLDGGD